MATPAAADSAPAPAPGPSQPEESSPLWAALLRMVQYLRKNHKENLEFEVRLGLFSPEVEFQPGFIVDHIALVQRLIKRIENNTKATPQVWTVAEPQYVMVRCEYAKFVRKTCRTTETGSQAAEWVT